MVDRVKAMKQLSELEKKVEELRKVIEDAPSLLETPEVGHSYVSINSICGNFMPSEIKCKTVNIDDSGNEFVDARVCYNYAAAMNTLLLLRHQPGTIEVDNNNSTQYFITPSGDFNFCFSNPWSLVQTKLCMISPAFISKEYADRAISKVGVDKIVHMFKTLHHMK